MTKENKINYVDNIYKIIPISSKHEIRVATSEDICKNSLLVDIRKFSLYGNTFDDIKRATNKGIKFKLTNIKDIVNGLLDIMVNHNILDYKDYTTIKSILNK